MRIVDLKLTYKCNNDCNYCCQNRKLREIDTSLGLDKIKEIINAEQKFGIDKVVLTGGEPTLNTEIIDIVKFIKGCKINNIQLQSNGKSLKNEEFLDNLIEAGVSGFAISLHGSTEEMHEKFSGTKKSFEDLIIALMFLKFKKMPVSLNCVITKHNVKNLSEIASFVGKNEYAKQLQFAFIHITGKASQEPDDYVSISEAAAAVKKAIDENFISSLKIYSEAIPFCLMYGREKAVSELYNDATVITYDFHEKRNFTEARLTSFKSKGELCKRCLFNGICEGVWREYPELYGYGEFVPIKHFRKNYDEY